MCQKKLEYQDFYVKPPSFQILANYLKYLKKKFHAGPTKHICGLCPAQGPEVSLAAERGLT